MACSSSSRYIRTFASHEILVPDKTGQHSTLLQYSGKFRKPVTGSDRGMYLEDLNESLRDMKEDIDKQELERPIRRLDPLLLHSTYKRFDHKWATRCVDAARPFTWLNEWWGPEPQNPLRLAPRSGPHPSSQGRLTPQYMGCKDHKKRKSDPGFILPGVEKRPKKEHKRFTEPQTGPEDRRKSEPTWPSPVNDLPFWQPPETPRPLTPRPKTKFCSFCGGEDQSDGSPLFLCENCNLVAYCSKGCQTTHARSHKPICQSAGKQSSPARSTIGRGDYIREGQDDVLARVLEQSAKEAGLDPAEVFKDQWRANVTSAPAEQSLSFTECDIVDFRVDIKTRQLEYLVLYLKTRLKFWRKGLMLVGDVWTKRMKTFWKSNATQRHRLWRDHLENAADDNYDPVAMGRHILEFGILDERKFEFFIEVDGKSEGWRVHLGDE